MPSIILSFTITLALASVAIRTILTSSSFEFYDRVIVESKRCNPDLFAGDWHMLYSHFLGQYCVKANLAVGPINETAMAKPYFWSLKQKDTLVFNRTYYYESSKRLLINDKDERPLMVFLTDYKSYAIVYEYMNLPSFGQMEYFIIYGRSREYLPDDVYSQLAKKLKDIGYPKGLYKVYQGPGCDKKPHPRRKETLYGKPVMRSRIQLDKNKYLGQWWALYATSMGQVCTDFIINKNETGNNLFDYFGRQARIVVDEGQLIFEDKNKYFARVNGTYNKIPMYIFDTDYTSYSIHYQMGETRDGVYEYFAIYGREPKHFGLEKLAKVMTKLNEIKFKEDLYEVYQGKGCKVDIDLNSRRRR